LPDRIRLILFRTIVGDIFGSICLDGATVARIANGFPKEIARLL